jgi:hypothetical protein
MYSDGQVLGSAVTSGAAVTALPLTSGNSIFQTILVATAVVAFTVLAVRVVKLIAVKKA